MGELKLHRCPACKADKVFFDDADIGTCLRCGAENIKSDYDVKKDFNESIEDDFSEETDNEV